MSRIDKAGAYRRAQRVRDGVLAVDDVIETLIEIQERQDWLALGYATWGEYCEGEFGPAKLKLTAEQRGRVVAVLAASGMSKRRVALALGVSEGTVRNDVKRSKGAQNYALEDADSQVNNNAAAGDANPPADDESLGASITGSSAEGPDGDTHASHEPAGPSVTPTDQPVEGEAATAAAGIPSASSPRTGVPAGDDPVPSEDLADPTEGAEEPGQNEAPVERPAPAPSDPPALLEWLADRFEEVDADVSGPLLTDADMARISVALDRIVFVVELINKWNERAQR